jgi:hypothetical protein
MAAGDQRKIKIKRYYKEKPLYLLKEQLQSLNKLSPKKERPKMKQIYKFPIKSKDIQWSTNQED